MGCYVNPRNETKESFLAREGRVIGVHEAMITETELPVCLVDNGMFKAAGVAFSDHELAVFADSSDPRIKQWFMVSKHKLRSVSDLDSYLS